MSVTIEAINLDQVERQLGAMKEKAPKVLKLAINDTAREARSRLAKEAQKTYAVKAVGFNRVMNIRRATNGNPVAVIHAKGKKIPLGKFSFRDGTLGEGVYYNPTMHRVQKGKGGVGAAAKVLKSRSRFKTTTKAKLKWFIARMESGHKGVFQRNAGMKRGQKGEISEKMGASIPEMIGDEKRVYGIVEPYIQSDLKDAVNRHVLRALKGEI